MKILQTLNRLFAQAQSQYQQEQTSTEVKTSMDLAIERAQSKQTLLLRTDYLE